MKFNHFFAAALVWTLVACGSTVEPIRYYQLPDSAFRLPENAASQREIAVQIVLAAHLNGNGLLYQTDDVHVNFAQRNLWASPLSDALAANLANKLNAATAHTAFVPHKLARKPSGSLKIYLDRFQGTHNGVTEISGYAQWDNGQSRAFVIQTAQQGDGYAAMVQSLNKGLQSVAAELVR